MHKPKFQSAITNLQLNQEEYFEKIPDNLPASQFSKIIIGPSVK